jgi:signal transduction histidine kinase
MLAEFNEIKQILIILLENSIDALSSTGGEVVVGAQGDDRKVRIWVQDNGHGITQDAMLRIFDPLFTTKHDHAGLGLAIVRNIIARHSADVEVESEQNVLTRFTLTFDKSNLLGAKS